MPKLKDVRSCRNVLLQMRYPFSILVDHRTQLLNIKDARPLPRFPRPHRLVVLTMREPWMAAKRASVDGSTESSGA